MTQSKAFVERLPAVYNKFLLCKCENTKVLVGINLERGMKNI